MALRVRFVGALGCLLLMYGFEKVRTPTCYVFPKGFAGWVAVDYGADYSPKVKIREGCYGLDFTASNRIFVSSMPEIWIGLRPLPGTRRFGGTG